VPEFKERGGQNFDVIIPIKAVFSSQIVLDCECIAKAQLDQVLFLLTQLARSGIGGELNLAFQVFGNGRFCRRKSNIDPNKPAKVPNLRRGV